MHNSGCEKEADKDMSKPKPCSQESPIQVLVVVVATLYCTVVSSYVAC